MLACCWNSKRPLVFAHVVLTKTLGIRRAQDIRAKITRRTYLWERDQHVSVVGDAEVDGASRQGRATSGGEKEDEAVSRNCYKTVILGKFRQAVCRATDREGGGCLLLDDQCTKTRQPVA